MKTLNLILSLFIVLLLSAVTVIAEPVKITVEGEAYGHHGQCAGWNSCGSAQGCALAACQANGFNTLVSYGDQLPCTSFNNCNLFNDVNTLSLQCEWGNGCAVMGVTDIWCDNGSWTGKCEAILPDQSNPPDDHDGGSDVENGDGENNEEDPQVPEFGVVAATLALVGAVVIVGLKRRV